MTKGNVNDWVFYAIYALKQSFARRVVFYPFYIFFFESACSIKDTHYVQGKVSSSRYSLIYETVARIYQICLYVKEYISLETWQVF